MTGFAAVNLGQLAAPNIVEALDYETILAALKTDVVARLAAKGITYDVQDIESDPIVKVLEVAAYREVLLRARVNSACRAIMLAYAQSTDLDHKATDFEVARRLMGYEDDQETKPIYETDEELRRRVQLAPEAFSTAGARGAYIFHALSADPSIKDAWAFCPEDGRADVVLAGANGAAISDEVIGKVIEVFKREDVTPLTDAVYVYNAERVDYNVVLNVTCQRGLSTALLKEQIEAKVRAYAAERYRIAAEVYRSGIIAAAFISGVETLNLASPCPDNVVCADHQIPHMASLTVTVVEMP
jgi:phage-related baseplate assembly protein